MNDVLPCPEYQPDHNGECLRCDEWMDAHSPEAILAGQVRASDCDCRNPRCGHKASRHTGPAGACTEAGCTCGPGGWM